MMVAAPITTATPDARSGVAAGSSPTGIEEMLVTRARNGDPRAFRMIFDRHATTVRRFLGDLLRDAAAADEATQETFVRAHRALPQLRDGTKLRGWLFGIARNVFHEQLRARKRHGYTTPVTDDLVADSLGPAPSPEQELLRREADAMLKDALAAIPDERRAVLLLRLDHDLGYTEIADVMEWNVAKVKNEIHRGRLQLRRGLAHYLGGTP